MLLLYVGLKPVVALSALVQMLVLVVQFCVLVPQLLNVRLVDHQVLLERVVVPVHCLELGVGGRVSAALARVLLSLQSLLRIELLLGLLVVGVGDLLAGFLKLLAQSLNVLDKRLIFIHDVLVVLLVQGQTLVQLVLQLLVRVRQELGLALELLLDVLVDVLLLLLAVGNVTVEVLVESQLELVVVVDALRHVVHGFLVPLHVGLVGTVLGARIGNRLLDLQLLRSLVIDRQTEARVERVEVLELAIELVRLQLEFLDLVLLGSDVPLEVLNLVIEHKFEFFKFLGLLFKFEDLALAIRNLVILLGNQVLLDVDVGAQFVALGLLLVDLDVFVLLRTFELVDLVPDVGELI